jgi:hypothetical protein
MTAEASASAKAHAPDNHQEGRYEGSPGNVEGPSGQKGTRYGSTLGAAQLSEILQVSLVGLVKPKLTDVFKHFAHLLHFSRRHESEGVPVPFVMDDAAVEAH